MDQLDAATDPVVTVDVATDGAGTPIVTIAGELDVGNVDAVDTAVAPVLLTRPARLIVDVRGLRFADSSAIALWLRWAASVDEFELRDPQPLLRKVIKMMGLAEKMELDQ
jgi:anti-anti-sigma factor